MSSLQQIGLTGNFIDVPHIPSELGVDDIHLLFPKGFEDILSYTLESTTGNIVLEISTDENRENSIITISKNLYNPKESSCVFPRFLIEQNLKYPSIDYLTDTRNRFIFNQNELLYICLQNRLVEFKKFKNAYANLLNNDIRSVMEFINYIPASAYNAIQKEQNSYIVLSIFDFITKSMKKIANSQCLGNILKFGAYHPTKKNLAILLQKLPIHYSSESMGEGSKYVLHSYDKELYRSVGYRMTKDKSNNPVALSLFKPAQNVSARNKTHTTADAYRIANFEPTSLFIQDYIPNQETREYLPKDECYVETLCVIHPILDNQKFLFGEVEASAAFVETRVIERESVSQQFENIFAEKDVVIKSGPDQKVLIGLDITNKPIYIENCDSVKLVNISILGTLGVNKLTFEVTRACGNVRADSNTGLKGVTTCRPNLGKIVFPELKEEISPTLVFGMNSFKAKGNSIELARAALATKLGYYTPKNHGLLNTLDIEEINNASKSLPEYYYEDQFGVRQKVQIGIVYTRITELCYIFKSFEKKSFSFEFGRVLHSLPDQRLFNNIWENYVDEKYKQAVIELEKIQLDKKDLFNDELPIYTLESIRSRKIFTTKDLISNILSPTESSSKLLDEEFNKGFFINFLPNGGKVIRIPSAKTLKLFCSQNESQMYMYPSLLLEISKILQNVLLNRVAYLFPKTETNFALNNTPIIRYYKEIKGLLFSNEDSAVMMVQKLSRPEIPGIAMKQTTDYILPDNVVVVMCDKTFNHAIIKTLGKDYGNRYYTHKFRGLHGRAPFLWQAQSCPLVIWSKDDFRLYLKTKHNIELEDYIHPTLNHDVLIFSNNVFEKSQSDQDGDHSTVFLPKGEEVQDAIIDYHNPHLTESEVNWIKSYVAGEFSANDDLIDPKTGELINHKYTLYEVPMHDIKLSRNNVIIGFSTFLFRAIEAKANIGTATNDGWVFNMLLDIYDDYAKKNDHKYRLTEKSEYKPMYRLTQEQRNNISFAYTQALQDFVVRGVKHTVGGSKDFEILFLNELWKQENGKNVFKLLINDLKLPAQLASKMMFIVTWCEEMGFLKGASAFLKLYNKGTIPTDPEVIEALNKNEEIIQQVCYFGMLLEPLYNLRKIVNNGNSVNTRQMALEKARKSLATDNFMLML